VRLLNFVLRLTLITGEMNGVCLYLKNVLKFPENVTWAGKSDCEDYIVSVFIFSASTDNDYFELIIW
jgi:hypothetical protein